MEGQEVRSYRPVIELILALIILLRIASDRGETEN
jgi:hypothetical protein